MSNKSKKQSVVQEPTESELKLYKEVTADFSEEQMDELSQDYFGLVEQEKTNVSFPRFIIDKFIRKIQPGDTIEFFDETNTIKHLFCLNRDCIEGKDYLLFALVESETETLITDSIYLFEVCEYDENGIEIIDIMGNNEETNRILDLMEVNSDGELAEETIPEEEK